MFDWSIITVVIFKVTSKCIAYQLTLASVDLQVMRCVWWRVLQKKYTWTSELQRLLSQFY